MVPIASEESTGTEGGGADRADPLRHAVHIALAIYLMPVVAIVCAIGGISIVVDKTTKLAASLATGGHRGVKPGHLSVVRSGSRPTIPTDRRRIRVRH